MMDSLEVYDIYDLWYTPLWWEKKSTWVVVGIFFLGLTFLLLLRHLKKRKLQKKLTPVQKALRALDLLEAQKDFLSHQTLYATLTFTLKEFLCNAYGKAYVSQTDKEFIEFLSFHDDVVLPHEVKKDLEFVFRGVEMVKFANQKAIAAKRDEDLLRSKQIVQKINFKNL